MRILIVDNQPRARQSMKALLSVWQPIEEIREAANGQEAVHIAEEFKPDLILMDVRMPVMTGLEATKAIRARGPHIKIVLLSMYSEYEAEALAAGADVFISKMEAPQELLRKISAVVQPKQTSA